MNQTERQAKRAAKRQRQQKAWELWRDGHTFEAIGRELSVSNKTAWEDVRAYQRLADVRGNEPLQRVRERLAGATRKVQAFMLRKVEQSSDPRAAHAAVKAIEEEAKIAGAHAPLLVAAKIQHVPSDTWRPVREEQVVAALSEEDRRVYLKAKTHVVEGEPATLPAAPLVDELRATFTLDELRSLERAALLRSGFPVPSAPPTVDPERRPVRAYVPRGTPITRQHWQAELDAIDAVLARADLHPDYRRGVEDERRQAQALASQAATKDEA